MSKFQCSDEVKAKVTAFETADATYKTAWEQFEQAAQAQLDYLDKLREDRNAKLDDAKRGLRAEALEADITDIKSIKVGPLTAQKKWTSFYNPEKLVAGLRAKGLYDTAIAAKVVMEKIETAKFDEVKNFLKNEGIEKDFEDCEDGQEMTPAVSGPKPIPAFGAEQKESK